MIWHTDTSQRRISFGGILSVFILAVVLLTFATHVAGEAPAQSTAYIECAPDGCQIDIMYPGRIEPIEFFVKRVVTTQVQG